MPNEQMSPPPDSFAAEAFALGGTILERRTIGTVNLAVAEVPKLASVADAPPDAKLWLIMMSDKFNIGSRRLCESRPDDEYIESAVRRHVTQSQSITRRN